MSISVPDDFNRVLFRLDIEGNQTSDPEDEDEYSSDEEEESNEYINASFIDVQNLILLNLYYLMYCYFLIQLLEWMRKCLID